MVNLNSRFFFCPYIPNLELERNHQSPDAKRCKQSLKKKPTLSSQRSRVGNSLKTQYTSSQRLTKPPCSACRHHRKTTVLLCLHRPRGTSCTLIRLVEAIILPGWCQRRPGGVPGLSSVAGSNGSPPHGASGWYGGQTLLPAVSEECPSWGDSGTQWGSWPSASTWW